MVNGEGKEWVEGMWSCVVWKMLVKERGES